MKVALCSDCRDFLRSNHNEIRDPERDHVYNLGRFEDSPDYERSIAQVLDAADGGCRLCEAIVAKLRSLQAGSSFLAQRKGQLVTFRLVIRPYCNTNLQWKEDIDRPFLQVSISHVRIEFRLWRMKEGQTEKNTSCNGHSTGSKTSLARAAEWLRECMAKHENCNRVNTPRAWVPSRLIDVGSRNPFPDKVKITRTKGWQTPIRYAALSHCWGAVQPLTLSQSNLQALMDGIPLAHLPKSFQDAIYTTRELGIQYLWIDSLCIIQDSSDDWELESSLMKHVYGGCLFNIAAAASDDCTGDLFHERPSSYLGPCLMAVESQNDALISWYQLWDKNLWDVEFETAKLNTRAWVMQERMLSPRTIAFTKGQLFWECRYKRACDGFASEYPMDLFERWHRNFEQPELQGKLKLHALNHYADSRLGDTIIPRLSLAWHNLVMLYSSKDITFKQDRLVAISGLADMFAQSMGMDYFAGLWKSTLLNDLLWEIDADICVRGRPGAYQAPSWSWASLECPVKYLPGLIKSNKVTVVEIEVYNVLGRSHFGRVTGGHLRLRGKSFPNLSVAVDTQGLYSLRKHSSQGTTFVAGCVPDERGRSIEVQIGLLCLPIGSYWDSTRAMGGTHYQSRGLVLLAANNQPRGYYKRWGAFKVTYSEFFDNPSNQAPIDCYVDGEEDTLVNTHLYLYRINIYHRVESYHPWRAK